MFRINFIKNQIKYGTFSSLSVFTGFHLYNQKEVNKISSNRLFKYTTLAFFYGYLSFLQIPTYISIVVPHFLFVNYYLTLDEDLKNKFK